MADHDTHDHTGIPGISAGDVATDPIWDAAGDLAVGTGANTAAKLSIGATNGMAVSRVSGAVAWALTPGHELDYVQFTSPVTVSASGEGSTTLVVTSSSVTYDGSAVLVEFFAPDVDVAASDHVVIVLYDDTAGASIGKIAFLSNPDAANVMRVPVHASRRLTPSAGARVYKITAYKVTNNGTVGAGAGGAGNIMPGFLRITKV